jgi:hypothetical protein
VVLVAVAGQPIAPAARGQGESRPPKVVGLIYGEGGDTSPLKRLSASTRHTRSLKFATRFDGERAVAPARTPVAVCGRADPCQTWQPIRREGGKAVIQLIHQSLEQTGEAKVRVRARRKTQLDDVHVLIVDAECHHEPPIYPRSCVIEVD